MSHVESDPEECIFHCTLPWRDDELNELIQRCNAMMSLSREHINIYLSIYLSICYIYIYIYIYISYIWYISKECIRIYSMDRFIYINLFIGFLITFLVSHCCISFFKSSRPDVYIYLMCVIEKQDVYCKYGKK